MAKLSNIVGFLDKYLRIADIKDSSFNGLQVEGSGTVESILFAVDAGAATFEACRRAGANMVVVHHGHYWKNADPRIVGWRKKRLEILYRNNISLYAAHLPLDLHPVVGNNIQLIKLMGATSPKPFGMYDGRPISFCARFGRPVALDAIVKNLSLGLLAECTVLPFGPKAIRSVAVLSGGGGHNHFLEAVGLGMDLYVSGEQRDFRHEAAEAKINVIFAGHHASETLGPKALAAVVAKKCGVKTRFVDIPTGL
jgi:dinuclear metal center YbgI/SA1388 family protein